MRNYQQIFAICIAFTERKTIQCSPYFKPNNVEKRYWHNFTGSKKREYHDRKLVGYSINQMYEVVSDVKNYQNFVPFIKKSIILVNKSDYLKANLEVGFPPIVECYTSHVTLVKPTLVKAVCKDGTLFRHMETAWKFSPGLKSNPQSSIIDFYINFEFNSIFHSHVANIFFDKLVSQMEIGFLKQVEKRNGIPSVPTHALGNVNS